MSIFSFVKSKLSILDVVLEYSQLKRAGGYWKGACPFHSETDASFTVSPDRQIFYCFGCHLGGDLIAFIAKIENMSQIEAVHHLIDKYAIQVPSDMKRDFTSPVKSGQKDQFFHTCDSAARWCHDQLLINTVAKKYLEKRSVGQGEWKRFSIGYFPGGTRVLNRFLKDMATQNVLTKDLIEAGVVAQGRTTLYSPFEERIIFPIRDMLGRGCGFGGRVFLPNDERAKYYNSKESMFFSKGKLLFGLDLAKKEMQYAGKAFLVEGYTDCVAMVQHGYKNTIATLGTACTADHLKTLSRYIKTLYVLYDGDNAGQKAILRLTKLCWEANLDLQIVQLEPGHDPASFLESHGKLDLLVDRASDIITFFVGTLGEQFWGKSLSEKMELCDKIIQVLARVDDAFKRDLLLQQAASVMQIPFESLKLLLERHRQKGITPQRDVEKSIQKDVVCEKFCDVSPIEKKIASIVINNATGIEKFFVDKDLLPYFSKPVKAVLTKIALFNESPLSSQRFDSLLEFFDDPVDRDWVIEQSFVVEEEFPYDLLEKLQFRFRKNNWKRIVQDMKKKVFQAKQQCDEQTVNGLLHSFLELKKEMKERGLI
ncbi:DNA primase [Candidatus Dependentiae bacterium]|nr:DNA primase [Candidatus Dependentiae bacterium]